MIALVDLLRPQIRAAATDQPPLPLRPQPPPLPHGRARLRLAPGVETASAGLAPDAEEPVTPDHLDQADLIFVMERAHRAKLQRRFGPHLKGKRVICLDIPDVPDSACGASGMTTLITDAR